MSRTFNGTSDYLEQLAAPITDYPLTYSCWFNKIALVNASILAIDTITGVCRVVGDNRSTGEIGLLGVTTAGVGAQALKGTYTIATWNNLVATCINDSDRTVYLNGVASTTDVAFIPVSGLNHLHIGARYATTRGSFYDGSVAECAIWNTALNQAEISSLAKGFCPKLIRPVSLKAYIPLIRELHNLNSGIMTASGTTVSDHPRMFY